MQSKNGRNEYYWHLINKQPSYATSKPFHPKSIVKCNKRIVASSRDEHYNRVK